MPNLAYADLIPEAAKPRIERAWLVGSQARGDARPDSDIDILLEPRGLSQQDLVDEMTPLLAPLEWIQPLRAYWNGSTGMSDPKGGRPIHFVVIDAGEERLFPERTAIAVR